MLKPSIPILLSSLLVLLIGCNNEQDELKHTYRDSNIESGSIIQISTLVGDITSMGFIEQMNYRAYYKAQGVNTSFLPNSQFCSERAANYIETDKANEYVKTSEVHQHYLVVTDTGALLYYLKNDSTILLMNINDEYFPEKIFSTDVFCKMLDAQLPQYAPFAAYTTRGFDRDIISNPDRTYEFNFSFDYLISSTTSTSVEKETYGWFQSEMTFYGKLYFGAFPPEKWEGIPILTVE